MRSAGSISIIGLPAPQGSKTAFTIKRKGAAGTQRSDYRSVVTDVGSKKLPGWRQAVAAEASAYSKKYKHAPIDQALELHITFYLPRPKSLPARVEMHAKKPDVDKLARAVMDALTGIIFTDDARIYRLVASKWYAADSRPPGAEIRWETL